MGGGASSAAQKSDGGDASKTASSTISPASVLSVKDKLRVKELESQVHVLEERASGDAARIRDLEARLRASEAHISVTQPSESISGDSASDYAKFSVLSAARRDEWRMKAVFERHKDVAGGLSQTALMAALREVEAPVLSSSEFTSDNSIFRRADSNLSGAIDQNEYVSPSCSCLCRML
jgi:hypothetical protein